MDKPNRGLALVAYLLSICGWLYVLLFHRKDKFAVFHARQSMMLTVLAIVTPAMWAVVAWALTWIPLAGPLVAVALFSLVLALYVLLGAIWIVGMVYALQARVKPLPVLGEWVDRLFPRSGVN